MAIELRNLRAEKPKHVWDVKVDRSSPLGNPFTEGTRDQQCDRYELWFQTKVVREDYKIVSELWRLLQIYKEYGKLRLFCWCVPNRCHSETIKKELESAIKELVL